MKNKNTLVSYIIFCVGIAFAFGFITLLKFQNPAQGLFMFVLCLVGMHAGIVMFIVSKKLFTKNGLQVKRFYDEEYFYLLFYIPVLVYKFVLSNIFSALELPEEIMMTIVLTITAVSTVLSIRNAVRFAKDINNQAAKDTI